MKYAGCVRDDAMSLLLSFDVGVKHLAYCALDASSREIVAWDVVGLPAPSNASIERLCRALGDTLADIEGKALATSHDGPVDVLVEQQTARNVRMKVLSHCIQMFFERSRVRPYRVSFRSTASRGLEAWGSKDRRAIKREAVDRVGAYLRESDGGRRWRDVFAAALKKDDLADCLLQALGYVEAAASRGGENVPI